MKDSQMARQRHELFTSIAERSAAIAMDFNLTKDEAEQLGWMLSDSFAEEWGGQQMNFPKDVKYHLTKRDTEIYSKFKGNNYWELSLEYKLSTRAIRKIIERAKKHYINERQPTLF